MRRKSSSRTRKRDKRADGAGELGDKIDEESLDKFLKSTRESIDKTADTIRRQHNLTDREISDIVSIANSSVGKEVENTIDNKGSLETMTRNVHKILNAYRRHIRQEDRLKSPPEVEKRRVKMKSLEIECYIKNMGKYVKEVRGLPSNSASPTDTYILKLQREEVFGNFAYIDLGTEEEDTLDACFVKVYPASTVALDIPSKEYLDIRGNKNVIMRDKKAIEFQELTLKALDYEANVYSIILDILNHMASPFFLRLIFTSKNCSFSDVHEMLGGVVPLDQIARNFDYCIAMAENRPSINEPATGYTCYFPSLFILTKAKYNAIVTQTEEDVQKLSTMVYKLGTYEIGKILFMVAIACYNLQCYGIQHNDLHAGNIFIVDLGRSTPLSFCIKKKGKIKFYTIETRYIPKLYDFDRSYCKKLGKNPLLSHNFENLCKQAAQCNKLIDNLDFIKICCYIYKIKDLRQNIKMALVPEYESPTKQVEKGNLLDKVYNHMSTNGFKYCYLQYTDILGRTMAIDQNFCKLFNDMTTIIDILYKQLEAVTTKPVPFENFYLCCDPPLGRVDMGNEREILYKKHISIENYF